MGEILKNNTSRVATLCKCRTLPNELDMMQCQKKCKEWEERRDGWCLFFEANSKMCTHLEDESTQKEDAEKPSPLGNVGGNLIKNLYKDKGDEK